MVPKDLAYTDQHEWIRMSDGVGTVGITDHAQDAMGDVTFVELPPVDAEFGKGEEVGVVESAKAAAGIYAPAAGKIVKVNVALEAEPGQVNADPHGAGWIYKIRLRNPGEIDGLMDAEAYEKFLTEEEP